MSNHRVNLVRGNRGFKVRVVDQFRRPCAVDVFLIEVDAND